MVQGDDSAIHFGGFVDDNLICTASLFPNGKDIRLRKFATDPTFQGKGHGSAMLEHLIEYAKAQGAQNFWFDARKSAVPFYQRFGFQVEGSVFFKEDVPYLRMTQALSTER